MRWLVVSLLVLVAIWLVVVLGLLVAGRKGLAREMAMLLPNLLALFTGLARDPAVPRKVRWLLVFTAAWIASPIDLIPEFIPVLGPLDDALVAVVALRVMLRSVDRAVVAEHWRGDPATLERLLRLAGRSP